MRDTFLSRFDPSTIDGNWTGHDVVDTRAAQSKTSARGETYARSRFLDLWCVPLLLLHSQY